MNTTEHRAGVVPFPAVFQTLAVETNGATIY